MGCRIGLIIYCILQLVAFLFILVGTPIDMFRLKKVGSIKSKSCLTMWGTKSDCYSTKYDDTLKKTFPLCDSRVDRFRAAEAFAIINIFVYLVACILGFIQLCCCQCFRWICLVLNIVGITAIVSWAVMADAYLQASGTFKLGTCNKLKGSYNYGAGFALFVTAWCLDIVNIVFLMLPC